MPYCQRLNLKKLGKCLAVWLKLVTFAPMNKKEKLLKRFRTLPKDFTFEEWLYKIRRYDYGIFEV